MNEPTNKMSPQRAPAASFPAGKHVCPWWAGYLLASPIRKLIQNPDDIIAAYIQPGMKVLDLGCAMGFFTIPAARMVGSSGRVIAVDLQERMLRTLRRRAKRRGLAERIEMRPCTAGTFAVGDLATQIDFALLFDVVHEVPSPGAAFAEAFAALKPGGKLLFVEPKGHVREEAFLDGIESAESAGFNVIDRPRIRRGYAALLQRP